LEDLPKALGAVLEAVAQGEITPSEGQTLTLMIEAYRKAFEVTDFEARLTALEKEDMASIKKRLERLEGGRPKRGAPIILVEPGETKEQAKQRHLAKHPEDKNAEVFIIICEASLRNP
jgi:hypothetical protein